MKTILVTGASGFVGSHALMELNGTSDIRLIAACRNQSRLPAGYQGESREGDVHDRTYLEELFEGVDVVCQCMAWSSLWGQTENSRRLFYQPNIDIIDAARAQGVKRIVNLSSTSAASPQRSADPMSRGIERDLWPHMRNVVRIENYLRDQVSQMMSVMNLRLGLFAGQRYALGLLPILLPRLKTHLVPWVAGGKTHLPITDGRDIGYAVALAALAAENDSLQGYQSFNIIGASLPTVREVIDFIHAEYAYPKPHFSVPFSLAYPFAWLMEKLDKVVPWEPLVTRSIIHLMEETHASNDRATALLGYQPRYDWHEAIRAQVEEMAQRQHRPMSMVRPIS